jgi:hypothetical protein
MPFSVLNGVPIDTMKENSTIRYTIFGQTVELLGAWITVDLDIPTLVNVTETIHDEVMTVEKLQNRTITLRVFALKDPLPILEFNFLGVSPGPSTLSPYLFFQQMKIDCQPICQLEL